MNEIATDVLIIGASLAGAAAAKRTVDAGLHTITIEKKELPPNESLSRILSNGSGLRGVTYRLRVRRTHRGQFRAG